MPGKKGFYVNIDAKRKRIARGSGEKTRKPGEKGAPSKKDFQESAKTAQKPARKAKSGRIQSGQSKEPGTKTESSSKWRRLSISSCSSLQAPKVSKRA